MNPLAFVNRALHVAADAQSPLGIEQVEADPVRSGWAVQRVVPVIHAERPFLVPRGTAFLTLAQPVNIVGACFHMREVKSVRPHPGSDCELTSSADAVVGQARDFDVGITSIKI